VLIDDGSPYLYDNYYPSFLSWKKKYLNGDENNNSNNKSLIIDKFSFEKYVNKLLKNYKKGL
jgi:hypothetical protein